MAIGLTPTDLYSQSQLCRGSLGDNIFPEGDFGSGRNVLVVDDPRIAPGYQYTLLMPPDDGFYTITNDIGRWFQVFPTWLTIGDNSDDPYGYMMVVNANYEPGKFYEQTVDGICENTLYEFSADILNIVRSHIRDHIYPDVSFLIDGMERYSTGRMKQTEEWQKVGFTFRSRPGQNSIRLTLRNNAPGGSGNDLALDNISFRACGPYAFIQHTGSNVVCENSDFPVLMADIWTDEPRPLQWQMSENNGDDWQDLRQATKMQYAIPKLKAGTYHFRYVHAVNRENLQSEKCRATSDIFKLDVRPSEVRRDVTIKLGELFALGDKVYEKAGTYRHTFTSSWGCDSTVIVTLEVVGGDIAGRLDIEHVICIDGNDGKAILKDISGGIPPYTYAWSSGATTPEVVNLAAGKYAVTVSDVRKAKMVKRFEVDEPDALIIAIAVTEDKKSAQAQVTGGSAPYDYNWSTGNGESSAVNQIEPGDHGLTVTDANGCTAVKTFMIPAPEPVVEKSKLIPELTVENLVRGEAIRMERVQFEADSSTIQNSSIPTLTELLSFLETHEAIRIEIGGHTNGMPAHDYCDKLSSARAKSIADWLVTRGIETERVFSKGYGKRNPIATNRTPEGRKKNQRVEVRIIAER